MNPERAALKVGYSKTTARTKAYLWVSNSKQNPKPQVKEFLEKLLKNRSKKLEISAEKIEKELYKIAFSNITDILEKMKYQVNLHLLKNLSEDEQHAIAEITEIESDKVNRRQIKMHNKIKALELLLKRIAPEDDGDKEVTINIYKDDTIKTKKVKFD